MVDSKKKVLVIGDVILDKYIDGTFMGAAAETGRPVFNARSVSYMAGGAGNVLLNIAAAGIDAVIMGVIGTDLESSFYERLLEKKSGDTTMILTEPNRTLSVKTRYMVNEHQVFRCDREVLKEIQKETESKAINCLKRRIREFDIIVIVDYEKGMMTKRLKQEIVRLAGVWQKKLIVDTKSPEIQIYGGAFLIKTNHKELEKAIGLSCETHEDIKRAASALYQLCGCEYVLTTCEQFGILLTRNNINSSFIKSHLEHPAVCTIGAGDTVTAYLIIGIIQEFDLEHCVSFASTAAGIAVSSPKTTVVDYGAVIQKYLPLANKKMVTRDMLVKQDRPGESMSRTNITYKVLDKEMEE